MTAPTAVAAPTIETAKMAKCHGCRSYARKSTMERRDIDGHTLIMCADPRSCRRRAQLAGEWKTL